MSLNRFVCWIFSGLILLASSCKSAQENNKPVTKNEAWALLPFKKPDRVNPIMTADASLIFTDPILNQPVLWAEKDVFNPAAIVRNDTVFLLFRAEDKIGKFAGTSRVGLAYSTDGLHFTKFPEPVLYPENDAYKSLEWEGGCEDPRIVQDSSGRYFLTYSSYDGDKARLMVASSHDLRHWTKHGLAFAEAYGGRYAPKWSKSGAIITQMQNGKPIAVKIMGKYWMYWGDVNIWAATSDDLIHWSPVLYKGNEKPEIELRHNAAEFSEVKIVFGPRKNFFDSDLVEPGPPALLTDKGILLLYNSRNAPENGDPELQPGTYAAAQILMDKNDPTKVLQRMDTFFIKPEKPYEIEGQVNRVCFIEGLVLYKNNWFLYYGTADSKIAVAVK